MNKKGVAGPKRKALTKKTKSGRGGGGKTRLSDRFAAKIKFETGRKSSSAKIPHGRNSLCPEY